MATLKELWLKVANNARLTPLELDEFARYAQETQDRNAFVANNTTAGNRLVIPQTYEQIYSEVFQATQTSITVQIPGTYRHLMILGYGRCTSADTASHALCAQFNGDTGNNYSNQYILSTTTVVTAGNIYNSIYFAVGNLAGNSSAAGKVGGFTTHIPHYQGAFHKSGICNFVCPTGADYSTGISANFWSSTDAIRSARFFVFDGSDIVAGSSLSIYGIV